MFVYSQTLGLKPNNIWTMASQCLFSKHEKESVVLMLKRGKKIITEKCATYAQWLRKKRKSFILEFCLNLELMLRVCLHSPTSRQVMEIILEDISLFHGYGWGFFTTNYSLSIHVKWNFLPELFSRLWSYSWYFAHENYGHIFSHDFRLLFLYFPPTGADFFSTQLYLNANFSSLAKKFSHSYYNSSFLDYWTLSSHRQKCLNYSRNLFSLLHVCFHSSQLASLSWNNIVCTKKTQP